MKLADIHQMRRKAETFVSHQQKMFVAKMEKRQETWVREHTRFSSGTNLAVPHGEKKQETPPPPEDEAGPSWSAEELEAGAGENAEGGDNSTKLPAIAYLTEATDITPRDENTGETSFLQPVDTYERAPVMLVGLPPIGQAKKSGFQPSGNIDDLFDDKAMKKSIKQLPPWKAAGENEAGDSQDPNALPAINPADGNALVDGRETKMSGVTAEVDAEPSPTPLLVLSRTLPRIQVRAPPTRKHRARRSHQPKVRRRRKIEDSADEMDNPLGDERFVKLHQLLASEVVVDHETRELSALARGLLAAKRFGRNWTDK